MLISWRKNATTTPAIRDAIQKSIGSDYELARQFNLSRDTIRKWRKRHTVQDASHTAHRLRTTLNAGQEELVIYLRTQLLLPLDDLLAVVKEFIEPSMRAARRWITCCAGAGIPGGQCQPNRRAPPSRSRPTSLATSTST